MKLLSIERITASKYNHLLAILLLFLWTAPFVERGQRTLGYRLITMALLCIIILCLRATIASKQIFRICVLVVGLALLFDIIGKSIQPAELGLVLVFASSWIYAIFIAATIICRSISSSVICLRRR